MTTSEHYPAFFDFLAYVAACGGGYAAAADYARQALWSQRQALLTESEALMVEGDFPVASVQRILGRQFVHCHAARAWITYLIDCVCIEGDAHGPDALDPRDLYAGLYHLGQYLAAHRDQDDEEAAIAAWVEAAPLHAILRLLEECALLRILPTFPLPAICQALDRPFAGARDARRWLSVAAALARQARDVREARELPAADSAGLHRARRASRAAAPIYVRAF